MVFCHRGIRWLLFYLVLVAFVSLVIAVKLGFKGEPYFVKLTQALTTGLTSNGLTYLLMWVMLHNLVYVL